MKMLAFSKRCAKEISRDPLTLFFGIGFPVVLLLLLTAINKNIPAEAGNNSFALERLTPGITVFSLSFLTLFSAMIISKDRASSLLRRLYTTPLTAADFIIGYALPFVPIALVQCAVSYTLAFILGLAPTVNALWATLMLLPTALFFVSLGLLCGSVLSEKQVGGVCGALLTNVCGWLAGIWFDLSLVGGAFETIAGFLPFVHAVKIEQAVFAGDFGAIFPDMWWVLGYDAVTAVFAVILFTRQMKKQ